MPAIESVHSDQTSSTAQISANGNARPTIGTYVGTVALVGLGVALIEEELLAGVALGVAAMAFPNLAPKIGSALRPLLKSAVRAGYDVAAKTRETVAEMNEQFQDVVAEVRAEQEHADTDTGRPSAGTAGRTAAAEHEPTRKRPSRSGPVSAAEDVG